MREAARIPEIIRTLEKIWKLDPDLRLGQIIVNSVKPSTPCPQVYYIEDDALLEGLKNELERVEKWKKG